MSEIYQRLLDKYPLSDGWITMGEVQPHGTTRRMDALSIMAWGSRGFEAMGFEIKVSRGDWLRELKDPAKAEPLVRLCTRWWICAPPDVVKVAELPEAWGLMVFHPTQIRALKQAPKLSPEPWSAETWRCFMLRLSQREQYRQTELDRAYGKGHADGYKAGENLSRDRLQRMAADLKERDETIAKARAATGVDLSRWCDYPALGAAMRALQNGRATHTAYLMRETADALLEVAKMLGAEEPADA